MQAGRELDALVAEKVMGWKYDHDLSDEQDSVVWVKRLDGSSYTKRFNASTDLSDAWIVVEKLNSRFTLHVYKKFKSAEVADMRTKKLYSAEAETAPLAICLAALKAVGWEGDEG